MSNIIIKSDIEDTYPLSPMQQGMLFQYQVAPESGYYIQQLVCSFREDLNAEAFKKAWVGILARYQILRTAFRWEGLEEPRQDVYRKVELPFELHDWQHLSADMQQRQFEAFLKADRKRVFNLTEAPPLRLSLIQLDTENYQFVWTYHHIILDGTSRRVILEELFTIYDKICQGKPTSLPPTIPYQDYIDWSQQQDTSKSKDYWRESLQGYNPAPISSTQAIGYLESEREYAEIHANLTEEATKALQTLANENQLTLNTIVQGAWAILLSRYSGEDDVVFGEVRAGRHWTSDKENSMVGLFINTVPMRIQISSKAKLLPWLRQIRQSQVSRREHENTPLTQIQGWSGIPRDTSLFESLYVYDNYHLNTRMKSKGGAWQNREFRLIEDNGFPITIDIYAESELIIKITCEKHHFDSAAVKRMLGHLKFLLEGIAADADRPLAEFTMLTEAERQQILVEWNDTKVYYPQDKLVHQIFESQVEKTPDSTAVVYEGKNLTYRELNQRANQLAHYLKSTGVGPESLVGIAVERSIEMIVGLYGILKAGGAYVPLDPTYPAERVAYMMDDASVPLLLTQQRLLEGLPPSKARVVCLDTDWNRLIAGQGMENPTCKTTPENLAYVIYTSGSTGKPKGAMNTHGGILNRLLWMQEAYRLTATDVVLQKTPFSFDVSVWEFFWPLMFGANLVVARPEGHKDSDYLIQTIIEQQVTTIHFVPSMLQIFLMARDTEKCTTLRRVICSGEALTPEHVNRFFTRLKAKLHNLYGPTETAVDVTYWECPQQSSLKIVPIGRPVVNTQTYILDRNMKPVPVGVPGELYIGGMQVGRGYYNRPELTTERFIPDPFSKDPKARLYKTGDSCRYLPDGNIEYLGRLDFQVKIRGNRIELGEIETLLLEHPDVREAVVTAREDIPGDMRLVAYIVFNKDPKATAGELRNYVRQKLPDFMVPSFFITLDKLPLTPNQKIDRQALPAPEKAKTGSEGAYIPPGNELQRTIADIWQEVLNVPKVGMNDNFFELGGHSLLLVRVYYRIHEIIDTELTLTDLFRYPTISTLVEYLAMDKSEKDDNTMESRVKRAEARRTAIQQRRRIRQKAKRNYR